MSDWSTEQDLKGNLMGEIEKRSCARKIKNLKVFLFFLLSRRGHIQTAFFCLLVCLFGSFCFSRQAEAKAERRGHQEVYQRELHFLQVTYYITLKDGDGEAGRHTHTHTSAFLFQSKRL